MFSRTHKICSVCGVEKPVGEFLPGRRQCKPCFKTKRQVTNASFFATWYAIPENKTKRQSVKAALYSIPENKAKQLARAAARYAIPENKTKQLALAIARYAIPENAAKKRASVAARYTTIEGKSKKQATDTNRRARQLNARGSHTAKEFKALCVEYDHRCAYCFIECEFPTRDHVIALDRGGSNDISNILPACLTCNTSKGPKLLWPWLGIRADLEKRLSVEAYEYYHC